MVVVYHRPVAISPPLVTIVQTWRIVQITVVALTADDCALTVVTVAIASFTRAAVLALTRNTSIA
ncbi:hypothetical protein PYCC9005_004613 [Savitreella phatthalungensis]